jgi:hypothetical protein
MTLLTTALSEGENDNLLCSGKNFGHKVKKDRQCMSNVTQARSRNRNHCCRGKTVSITYSECVFVCVCVCVALVIHHAKRMRHIMLSFVACPALQYFSKLFINCTIFGKKVIEHKMRVLIYSTTFVRNISHSKNKSARYCHKFGQVFM